MRPAHSIDDRVKAAHRLAHDHGPVDTELLDESFDILGMAFVAIVVSPVAVAMPALVQGQAMVIIAQRQADYVPGMSGQRTAMQKDQRGPIVVAPVQIMQAKLADSDLAVLRKYDLGYVDSRYLHGQFEVFELFECGHYRNLPFTC